MTIHMIANAHLDPVWLWDWREGLNEALLTCRTVLDLMDESPNLVFIRGEAAIYRHIEETAPDTFARIEQFVHAGRWDVVGGTWIQPDTNLSSTETLCRHFQVGHAYFKSRFGAAPRVAWAADSFGHSAGLPEILASAGVDSFAFSRPAAKEMPLEKPAFWWQSPSGARVLAYRAPVGWYGCERDELLSRLDEAFESASRCDLQNIGVFYGVGNHGGGPTRRFLREIEIWREAHPTVEVLHSGLHRFFDALRAEAEHNGDEFFPTKVGELNFCLRGCYSSASKIKYAFRRLEAAATRAETLSNLVGAATGEYSSAVDAVWETVLFNSFHDILPGTSIERALEDQLNEIGGALFNAQKIELRALNLLAAHIDTQVAVPMDDFPTATPFLLWNPHPHSVSGFVEIETNLDYRPLFTYQNRAAEVPIEVRGPEGQTVPFQRIAHEHDAFADSPWRARVLFPATLPPLGWSVFTVGYVEGAQSTPALDGAPVKVKTNVIENQWYRVVVGDGLKIFHRGSELFEGGLQFLTIRDEWGTWGGMSEEAKSLDLSEVLCRWELADFTVLEFGPLRTRLWTHWQGGNSQLDLTLSLSTGREVLDAEVRLLWNERAARLKMVMNARVTEAVFDVPGASITRSETGHVPGGRWVNTHAFGFASDALYDFDIKEGALRTTLARATRYASNCPLKAEEDAWRPTLDRGELKLRFLIAPPDEDFQNLARYARELEKPHLCQLVVPSPGTWPRVGSLAALQPAHLELLSLTSEDGSLLLRVRETAGLKTMARFTFGGVEQELGDIGAYQIKNWRLEKRQDTD